ncbi:MAG: PD-(D/E)XK nuclease family protein [Gemmataceae bacterium]
MRKLIIDAGEQGTAKGDPSIPQGKCQEDVRALERFVVENDDLLALESSLGKFNIFDALRLARAEIRHSNFLAFILDPAESHGQGQVFLKAVIADLLKSAQGDRPLSPIELDGIDLRGVEIRREWERIDLLILCQTPPFVIAIENKIGAKEGHNQLDRYRKLVLAHFPQFKPLFVYLTPDGKSPSKAEWMPYRYGDLYRVLRRIRNTNENAIGRDVLVFLDHYLSLIGARFMNDPRIDELCRRIYKNHRQALDLIFDRVGGPASGVLREAEAVLADDARWHIFSRANQDIRFVPKSWLEWLPSLGSEEDPRSWIICRFRLWEGLVEFYVQVRDMEDKTKRNYIVDRLIAHLPALGLKKSKVKIGKAKSRLTRVSGSEALLRWDDDEPDSETVRVAVKKKLEHLQGHLDGITQTVKQVLGLNPTAASHTT